MGRLATAVCTIPALIGWLAACSHTGPSMGSPPDQAAEQQRAADLLGRVKQRYIEINPKPQRITQRTRTVLRSLNEPDTETRATLVTLQVEDKQRTDMTESEVIVPAKEAGGKPQHLPGGQLSSVRIGSQILVQYQGANTGVDGKPVVISYKIDESKLDPALASLYGGDLATLKLFDMLATDALRFREEASEGAQVFVVETVRPVLISRDTEADIELWINPKSLLVDRMRMKFDQKVMMGKPTVVHGEYEGDFTYEFDVPVPPEAFELHLHPNAEDFTDEVQDALKSNPPAATPR